MPSSLARLLLSLLLLITQHMALVHGYSHWSGATSTDRQAVGQQGNDGNGGTPKPTLHQLCGQCAASAELAFALPAMPVLFVTDELVVGVLHAPDASSIRLPAIYGPPPRGPPQA